jgi:hypothetical protein
MIDETDEHGALARAALALRTVRLLRKTGRTAIADGGSVAVFPGVPSKETTKRTATLDIHSDARAESSRACVVELVPN